MFYSVARYFLIQHRRVESIRRKSLLPVAVSEMQPAFSTWYEICSVGCLHLPTLYTVRFLSRYLNFMNIWISYNYNNSVCFEFEMMLFWAFRKSRLSPTLPSTILNLKYFILFCYKFSFNFLCNQEFRRWLFTINVILQCNILY